MAHLRFAGKSAATLLLLILGLLGAVQLAMAQGGLQSSYLIDLSSRLTTDYEGAIQSLRFAPAAPGLLEEIRRSETQAIVVVDPVINLTAPDDGDGSGEFPAPAEGPTSTTTQTATSAAGATSSATPGTTSSPTLTPTSAATATAPGSTPGATSSATATAIATGSPIPSKTATPTTPTTTPTPSKTVAATAPAPGNTATPLPPNSWQDAD